MILNFVGEGDFFIGGTVVYALSAFRWRIHRRVCDRNVGGSRSGWQQKPPEGQRIQVFIFGSEHHFAAFFAHAACFYTGIFFQIVIPNRMVEDCTQLILNGLEINRRVGSSVLIAIVDQFILLADHLLNNSLFYGRLGVLGGIPLTSRFWVPKTLCLREL